MSAAADHARGAASEVAGGSRDRDEAHGQGDDDRGANEGVANELGGGSSGDGSDAQSGTPGTPTRRAPDDRGLEPQSLDRGARRVYRAHLTHLCGRMLGSEPVAFSFPGGTRRDSCRMELADGRSVIATVRGEPERAELEARVLAALAPHGAPAPRALAGNRRILLQEDRGAERLSVALDRASASGGSDAVEALLDRALLSLADLQRAGHAAGLAERVPLLGVARWWVKTLIDRPAALGAALEIDVPRPEIDHLLDLLTVLEPRFVKWDARPANAVLDDAGAVAWIDFEHCGARNPLDDLAWLLADEYVPHDGPRDDRLLERHGPRFGGSLPPPLLPHYARAMLTLHATHRLNLILDAHGGEGGPGWADAGRCLRRDAIGVARPLALRQCERAAYHAERSSLVTALAPFYAACRERIAAL